MCVFAPSQNGNQVCTIHQNKNKVQKENFSILLVASYYCNAADDDGDDDDTDDDYDDVNHDADDDSDDDDDRGGPGCVARCVERPLLRR